MLKTKRIVSTICVVFVFLGMMVLFPVDEAEANHSSMWCRITSHRSFPPTLAYQWVSTGSRTDKTNCQNCHWLRPMTYPHKVFTYEEETRLEQDWEHWVPFRWGSCHTHPLSSWTRTGRTMDRKVLCNRLPVIT